MAAGIHTGYILYSIFCKVTFPVTPVEKVAEQNAIPSEMARSLGFSCLYFLYCAPQTILESKSRRGH